MDFINNFTKLVSKMNASTLESMLNDITELDIYDTDIDIDTAKSIIVNELIIKNCIINETEQYSDKLYQYV